MSIKVLSYSASIPDGIIIDTTSRSKNWTRALSPFYLGPVELYDGMVSQNFENAWQFSKVYSQHTEDGEPTDEYWKWAKKGWADSWAHRYPMGRGAIPKYSLWKGEKLGYIDARKKIYIPLYVTEVKKTEAFSKLVELAKQAGSEGKNLYLRDFDAYDNIKAEMSYHDVMNCEERKMGHAFVIAMLLEGIL